MEPQLDVRSAMIPRERKSHLRAGEEHKRKFIKSESHPRCRVESAGAGGGNTHVCGRRVRHTLVADADGRQSSWNKRMREQGNGRSSWEGVG